MGSLMRTKAADVEAGASAGVKTGATDGAGLAETDAELWGLVQKEKELQRRSLQLIASENFPSRSALQCYASCFNNRYNKIAHKYSEGDIEALCEKRCLETFGLDAAEWGVNVRPYSGAIANLAVYVGLCNPHDRIMGLEYLEGGHYTHGYMNGRQKLTATSIFFETMAYKIDARTGLVDYDKMAEMARHFSPKLIVAGASCYSRHLDYRRFREAADEVGAYLMCDMAHVAGLVAAGLAPSPFEHCHVLTTCTYKSLRGTKGSVVFFRKRAKVTDDCGRYREQDLETRINRAVFPGVIGACMENVMAAIATVMKEAATPAFRRYQAKVLAHAQGLCGGLQALGYDVVTGGTDLHMMLVDLRPRGLTAAQAEFVLHQVNISVTTFPVPGDEPSRCSHGLRIGTTALTTRGLGPSDFHRVLHYFHRAIQLAMETKRKTGDGPLADFKRTAREDKEISHKINKLKEQVSCFAENFTVPGLDEI